MGFSFWLAAILLAK